MSLTTKNMYAAIMARQRQRGRRNKPTLKDYMDEICDSNDYYRKHVAHDGESLFRSISDGVFGSQNYKFIVAKAAELLLNEATPDEKEKLSEFVPNYPLVCRLAEYFHFRVEIISAADETMTPFTFIPKRRKRSKPLKNLLLCFTPPRQFDPIVMKDRIISAGFCQSILYELLYAKVFGVKDAMTAAIQMIYGNFENGDKPEVLIDESFEGTAMQALGQHLIPFPYKVAKCLDPHNYRNIEFDVWNCQRNEERQQKIKEYHEQRARQQQTLHIGKLARGTPCMLRSRYRERIFGYVQGPCTDRRLMAVYIPLKDITVYVRRSMVLPIEGPPEDQQMLPKWPDQRPHFTDFAQLQHQTTVETSYVQVEETQRRNITLINSRHTDWLQHSDFTIPPPPVPPEQRDARATSAEAEVVKEEPESSKPKPDPIKFSRSETPLWDFEHYAGCYACQAHESTPTECRERLEAEASAQGIASSPLLNHIDSPPFVGNPDIPQQFVVPIFPIGTYPTTPQAGPQFLLFSPLPPAAFDNVTPTIPGTPSLFFQYPSALVTTPMIPPQPVFVFPNANNAEGQNQPRVE